LCGPSDFRAGGVDGGSGPQDDRESSGDPALGLRRSQDPLGFDGGDTNLYRYVRNDPTSKPDSLGLFSYQWKPGEVKFLSANLIKGKISQIGYSNLFLDIIYSRARAKVSFIQVNTVITTVVTVDNDGKVAVESTTKYYEDATSASDEKKFSDRMGGPSFDAALRDNAVIVISRVFKEHGLIPGLLRKVPGREIEEARAKAIKKIIGAENCLEKGDISYAYYWSEIDKATARSAKPEDLLKAIKEKIGDKETMEILDAAKGKNDKFDFEKFNCQFLISEHATSIVGKKETAGLYVEAGLNGTIKK
jgi:uncharacterized protein RhaS with RHS repeats